MIFTYDLRKTFVSVVYMKGCLMDERVNRRMALKKVLSSGVNMFSRIFETGSDNDNTVTDTDTFISPDQAGHMLRNRKTSKNSPALNLTRP